MRKWIVLTMGALLAWPALAAAQEKPMDERPEDRRPAIEMPEGLEAVADRAAAPKPDRGVAAAWARWLAENPDLADEAPRYGMIVVHQGVEPSMQGVNAWLADDDRPDACSAAAEADIERAREPVHVLFHDPDPDLADLDEISPRLDALADALEACRDELRAGIGEMAEGTPTPREPEVRGAAGEAAGDDDGPARAGAQARIRLGEEDDEADEDLDAAAVNARVERAEMLGDAAARLRALADVATELHAETRASAGRTGG